MNITYVKKQLQELSKYRDLNIETYLEEEKKIILQRAEELLANKFVFDKVWDMERCKIAFQLQPLDFNSKRNQDEEWTFMLNRMDYLCYLIQAYILKQDKNYLHQCKQIILTWISQHQELTPSLSTRVLDSAIRCVNMMDALVYLYAFGAISEEEIEVMTNSVMQQISYMRKHYVNKYTLSNWGSIQTCAIVYLLPMLVEDYKNDPIFQWAKKELETQMEIQVYEDGMFWEQSTMYHVEVLNYGMRLLNQCACYEIVLADTIHDAIYRLANALYLQATPTNTIETFGDSDRCLICDVMCRAAYVFRDGSFKAKAFAKFDAQSAYEFGKAAAKEWEAIEVKQDNQLTFDGVQSGMYTHKSTTREDASFTMFTHGSLGSGHGHCDNLHFSLYYKGKPFFIDKGRYTYRDEHPMREYLKSMQAHNTLVIDDLPVCMPYLSWDNKKFGRVVKPYVSHKEQVHYYEGVLLDDKTNATIIRKMLVIDPSIWLLCDEVIARNEHQLKQYFHLDPAVKVEQTKMPICLQNQDAQLHFHLEEEVQLSVSHCSLRYNELEEHSAIQTKHTFIHETHKMSAICNPSIHYTTVEVYQDDKKAEDSLVSARKFVCDENEHYVCVIFHKEVFEGRKIFYCEGIAFHAKSAVFHIKDGEVKRYVCKT